jgi:uncharacterized damage-inducible protein DinB
MDVHAIQILFDYNYTTHDRVWDCVMELTEEQFVAESDYSWRSLRNHLVHVMSVDNRWLARVQNQPLPDRLEVVDYPNQDTVREKWNDIRDDVISYVTGLTPDELTETLDVDLPHRGGKYQNKRWEILVHMVNHGTDHRAQILSRLHDLGAITVEQDMILYLWDRQRN